MVTKFKRIRVDGYRRDQAFKIWFWVDIPADRTETELASLKLIGRKAKEVNKQNRYYCSERIVTFRIQGFHNYYPIYTHDEWKEIIKNERPIKTIKQSSDYAAVEQTETED